MQTIMMLNPNSSVRTTEAIAASVAALPVSNEFAIAYQTLAAGPVAIESQADFEVAARLVPDAVASANADACVIACFADPGVSAARQRVDRPVLALAESSYRLALGLGRRFGIVSIVEPAVGRHARQLLELALEYALAGDRSVGLGLFGVHDEKALDKILAVARALRDVDGADVIVLGCASMGRHREAVELALGIPVIDAAQAAVTRAMSLLTLGYKRAA